MLWYLGAVVYGGLLGSSVSGVTSLVQYDGDVVLGHTPYTLTSCYASWWYAIQVLVAIGISYLLHRPTLSHATSLVEWGSWDAGMVRSLLTTLPLVAGRHIHTSSSLVANLSSRWMHNSTSSVTLSVLSLVLAATL